MSDKKFQEARGNLALSQQLLDKVRQPAGMEQQPPTGMPQEAPQEAPEAPQTQETPQESTETKTIVQAVQDAVAPLIEEVKGLITRKSEEPQPVEVRMKGELHDKTDEQQ